MTLEVSTADIAKRYLEGETMAHIAKTVPCHINTVRYRLSLAGCLTRKRARVNSRVLLETYREPLMDLLDQVEKAMEKLKFEFAEQAGNRERRTHYRRRIARLDGHIEALKAITRRHGERI